MILEKLKEVERWFLTQRKFSFYASSLLVVYEGDMQHNDFFMPCNQCNHGDCKCSTSGSSASHATMSTDSTDNASSGATDSTDLMMTEVDTELSDQTDGSSMTASVSSILSVDNQSCSAPVNNHNAIIADVRMIDFTHVFCVDEQDDNYLYGLQNLISHMQQLLDL